MMRWIQVLQALLTCTWLGVLLCIAFIAAPAAFAALERPLAGQVVARFFAVESGVSLLVPAAVVLAERALARAGHLNHRSALTPPLLLGLLALLCTVAGYYALQPMMVQAREGTGRWSFGQLHAVSLAFYGLKTVLAAALGVLLIRRFAAKPATGTAR